MNISNKFLLAGLALVLTGQGCVGLGGSNNESAGPDGSVHFTEDQGATWSQFAALPTSAGVSSIAGVSVTAFDIDPSDHSVLYMGTQSNGLLYSLDAGNSWLRPKGEEGRAGAIIGVEVDPNNVCTIYLLKTDRILKTQDCNRTYTAITVEPRADEGFTTFVLDWFNPSILWAGTSAGDIMKSVDSGESWSTVHRVRDGITDITVSNKDSRIILVGTSRKGLWRSIDGGATWSEFEDELAKDYRESDRVYGFAQNRTGSTLIMNSKFGLLVSKDQGATWKDIPLRTASGEERIWSVAIQPDNEDVIYYGTHGAFYTSVNGGGAWVVEETQSSRVPMVMMVHPTLTSRVFVGFVAIED